MKLSGGWNGQDGKKIQLISNALLLYSMYIIPMQQRSFDVSWPRGGVAVLTKILTIYMKTILSNRPIQDILLYEREHKDR